MTQPAPPSPPRARARRPRRASADYRWTMPKVVAFLEALACSGRVAEAARHVGMTRQSAYRLRARLADVAFGGTLFSAAFEGARRQGIRARALASMGRARSPWEGPGIAEMLALHAARQGDAPAAQGDACAAQGVAAPAQGYASQAQGDGAPCKASENPLDSVTPVTGLAPSPAPQTGVTGARGADMTPCRGEMPR